MTNTITPKLRDPESAALCYQTLHAAGVVTRRHLFSAPAARTRRRTSLPVARFAGLFLETVMRVICPMRQRDQYGAGYFGAPRGERAHNGIDYACAPGSSVLACESGKVTKLGYPYGDDLSYRYVEITDDQGCRARYFYVEPTAAEDEQVTAGDVIGLSQSLDRRYPGITEHVHFEVIHREFGFIDPGIYAGESP